MTTITVPTPAVTSRFLVAVLAAAAYMTISGIAGGFALAYGILTPIGGVFFAVVTIAVGAAAPLALGVGEALDATDDVTVIDAF